jgi:hypothetical protein
VQATMNAAPWEGLRTGSHVVATELRRISLPRTPVNRVGAARGSHECYYSGTRKYRSMCGSLLA